MKALLYFRNDDVYVIPLIAIGIDAFVPEADGLINLVAINGNAVQDPIQDVLPGETLDYCVEIINPGDESIKNFMLNVPLPQTGDFVPMSITSSLNPQMGTPNTPAPVYNPMTKSITWDIGDLPIPVNETATLAHFCF